MPGESRKRISMKMVAERAGLSISAVSMALSDSSQISEATKYRIRQVCRELGYPLDRRNNGRLHSLGRVGFLAVGDGVQAESLDGLMRVLTLQTSRRNIRLEVGAWADADDEPGSVAHLKSFVTNMDGLLVSGLLSQSFYATLNALDVPHVVLGHACGTRLIHHAQKSMRAVWSDEQAMGQAALRDLLARRRRRPAFLCSRLLRGLYASRWLDGVRLAMLDADLPLESLQVAAVADSADGIPGLAAQIAQAEARPDCLILPDMHVAPRLLAALGEHGISYAPADVILGGNPDLAAQAGLGHYPVITEDGETLVSVALDLLASSGRHSPFARVNLVVPYLTRNLQD